MQELGQFEVVSAPEDDQALLTRPVHRGGRFDEAVMLELGRAARADVIIAGTVTHYSAYHTRQRSGWSSRPSARARMSRWWRSVDRLWDTTDGNVAERCRAYYRQSKRPRPAWVRNHVIVSDDAFAGELALDSPALVPAVRLPRGGWACSGCRSRGCSTTAPSTGPAARTGPPLPAVSKFVFYGVGKVSRAR